MRREDIAHVGLSEVRLDLLDRHLSDFIAGKREILKPLVIFEEDRIIEEKLIVENSQVMIAEGTYTSVLTKVHQRVFIDRTYEDTQESRRLRGREKQDDFLEEILRIEHDIISSHKAKADVIITRDHEVNEIDGTQQR